VTADGAETRRAFRELLDTLREIDEHYVGAEARAGDLRAISRDHRFLMHLLGGGLDLFFEADPEAPVFRPTLHAGRKFYGDNPDAVYHTTVVRPDLDYRIRGNRDGAVYFSLTVEGGGDIDERYPPGRVVATRNDAALEIEPNGDYEIVASREPRPGNWLPLADDACSIVTRHYYEGERPVDRSRRVPLEITVLRPPGASPPPPPDPTDVDAVARGIRRVRNFVRGLSLDYERNGPPLDLAAAPANVFGDPPEWRPDEERAAVDQANLTAPFSLRPDEALLIDGRFPRCRFANIVLWNRRLQTLEFARRQSSLNRRQTELERDGSFRLVVAHEDPGLPNWLDTGGEREGLIFVRYLLPEEQPLPLSTRVVPLQELRLG
jgi:hypothetical protein